MGFEVTFICHPKKEQGIGYDEEIKEEKVIKIGKPFEDIPLENLAAAIMSQMARRDIWVVDVQVCELVRKDLGYKMCKDGMGIILKNRKFSFNESAQMIAEDVSDPSEVEQPQLSPQVVQELPPGVHPHELIANQRQQSNIDDLYGNPNKPVPIVKGKVQEAAKVQVNPKKVLYYVYFEPGLIYEKEVKRLNLKFSEDKKYPVHQIIPSPSGRLDAQKLAITDDFGRIVEVEEKYFSSAGLGLMADKELGFSGSNVRTARRPKLAYEGESYSDVSNMGPITQGVPMDDGYVPDEMLAVPDIRAGRRR